jgi:hypothetical protein
MCIGLCSNVTGTSDQVAWNTHTCAKTTFFRWRRVTQVFSLPINRGGQLQDFIPIGANVLDVQHAADHRFERVIGRVARDVVESIWAIVQISFLLYKPRCIA